MQYPEYYPAWLAMNRRCYNPRNRDYKHNGALGVTVCDAWHFSNDKGYLNYVNWLLAQPHCEKLQNGWVVARKLIIGGGYTPENCEIVTRQTSSQRRRTVKFTNELVVEARRLVRQDPSITLKTLCGRYGFGTEACWSRMLSSANWDNIEEPPINIRALRKAQREPTTCL